MAAYLVFQSTPVGERLNHTSSKIRKVVKVGVTPSASFNYGNY